MLKTNEKAKERIWFGTGYKYQLKEAYHIQTKIIPNESVWSDFINLNSSGLLTIKIGYAWDGPSGPTIDANCLMRGSLVHDALYQLMRDGYLDKNGRRLAADRLLQQICIEDGANEFYAFIIYKCVRIFGDRYA